MATPRKADLAASLRELGVEPAADASAKQLMDLLRKTRALPRTAPARPQPSSAAPHQPPQPRIAPGGATPPAPAGRPTFATPPRPPVVPRPLLDRPAPLPSAAEVLSTTPLPRPRSEHEARPHDPFAGF